MSETKYNLGKPLNEVYDNMIRKKKRYEDIIKVRQEDKDNFKPTNKYSLNEIKYKAKYNFKNHFNNKTTPYLINSFVYRLYLLEFLDEELERRENDP